MSGPERPEPTVETTRSLKRKNFFKDDQDDLDALDKVFKRIKAVAPRTPYILSTPSLDPYRYHSQQEANAWMMGHLWRHDEEHLQYRTYVYREPCQDCLELQAGEDDESQPERPDSQASISGRQTTKRKLNLSAFKVKQANGTVTPGSKKVSPNLAPTKIAKEQVNGVKKPEKQASEDQRLASKPSKGSSEEAHNERATSKSNDTTDRDPRPRPRSPSRKTDDNDFKVAVDKLHQSNGTPHSLPPMLSPIHEPPSNPYGLPNILSPTLPSNIQAELDKIEVQRKRAESNASTSSSDRKSQTLVVPDARATKPTDTAKSEPRIRSVSAIGKSPNIEVAKRKDDARPTLVVKLKFSKSKLPTVKQILRLPPKRTIAEKKDRQDAREAPVNSQEKRVEEEPKKKKPIPKVAARRSDNTTPASTPSAKPAAAAAPVAKVPEKRPRPDDDVVSAVPSKRPRAASSQDRPITPMQQGTSSPSLSTKSSAQKVQSQYTTPKNNHKAVSMLRTASAESNDSTPGRSAATPAGIKSESKGGPTSAPASSKRQADMHLLAQTSMKLNQLGRALKHEATKILTNNSGKQVTKQDEKRGAITNMECILSYMAAYYAQDFSMNARGRASEVEHTWKTLLPLCLSYARTTKEFKHLDGLRSYLSSVVASNICKEVSQRVATSRPHDSPQDVPHGDLAKQHATLTANLALLSDHNKQMNQHYQDARVLLPFEDIQSMYKKTYAGCEANAKLVKEQEKISATRLSGPYFLPISNDTTPLQAVRFGLKFLAEYCEKEKLDYTFRVNLDKPE
ncbi:hypothetical protein EK21DRAFT_98243 [Setomelanomma holmii]|uniref:Uncharacterized protein n=1 Tax=Setomelanomma holmii TaxID=210430 RepID=A0A9P4LN90_9PLEO|nr:hypothetical protein EK21DRAFT_98243 [Setomelanomma holmii]